MLNLEVRKPLGLKRFNWYWTVHARKYYSFRPSSVITRRCQRHFESKIAFNSFDNWHSSEKICKNQVQASQITRCVLRIQILSDMAPCLSVPDVSKEPSTFIFVGHQSKYKRQSPRIQPHSDIYQNTWIFVNIGVRTSNLTLCLHYKAQAFDVLRPVAGLCS